MNHLVFIQDDTEHRNWIAANVASVDTEFEVVMTLYTHWGDRPQVGLADLGYTMAMPRGAGHSGPSWPTTRPTPTCTPAWMWRC